MRLANLIAFILLVIGGITWLLIGIFDFNLVAVVFGAQLSVVARIIYILVGLSAIWLVFSACYARRINFAD